MWGTTQTALSRLERGAVSPSLATVERILFVMGETAELVITPLQGEHDPAHLADFAHLNPPGAAPYPDLAARALVIDVAGVSVSIAGRDDLIAMKCASGRPIDRGDVIALTAAERDATREP